MTKIRCVVERITYQNPDNGYSVLKVRLNGYDDLITVVGNLLDVTAGSVLSIRHKSPRHLKISVTGEICMLSRITWLEDA